MPAMRGRWSCMLRPGCARGSRLQPPHSPTSPDTVHMIHAPQIAQVPQSRSDVLTLGSDGGGHVIADGLPFGGQVRKASRGERCVMLGACLAASAVVAWFHGWRQGLAMFTALEDVHGGDRRVAFVDEGLHAVTVGVGLGVLVCHGNARG